MKPAYGAAGASPAPTGARTADAGRARTDLREPMHALKARMSELPSLAKSLLFAKHSRQRTQRAAIAAFAVRVASAALLYVMQIVLARWMGGHEYGIYVFAWTWVLVLGGLAHLGLSTTAIRLVPEYKEQGRFDLLRGLLRGGAIASFGTGAIIAALGISGVWLAGDLIPEHYVLPVSLALLCVPFFALGDLQDGVGRGQAWMGIALVPPYIMRPIVIIGVMLLAWSSGFATTAVTAAIAAIVATGSSAILQRALLKRRLADIVPPGKRSYDVAGWAHISAPLLMISACEVVLQNTDVLVISTFLTPMDAGIYFAAAKTMALIMFVHYAVGSAFANQFSALNARGDEKELRSFVRDAVRWTFWPSLAAAVLILALGKPLLWLFGPEFASGYPVMLVLVVGFLFRSAMGPAEFLLNMLGEQRRCAALLAASAVLNVVLNLLFVPWLGLLGAALATSLSLVAASMLAYAVVRSRLSMDIAIWRNL